MSLIDEIVPERDKEQILKELAETEAKLVEKEFQAELATAKAEEAAEKLDKLIRINQTDISKVWSSTFVTPAINEVFKNAWGKAATQATSMVAAPAGISSYLQNARRGHGLGMFPGGMSGQAQSPSYAKQKIDEAVASTKVVDIRKVWMHPLWAFKIWWIFKAIHRTPVAGMLQSNIMGCCVCKTVTPANIPFWKPFKVMKVFGLLKPEFPYRDIYGVFRTKGGLTPVSYEKRDYHFAVCSEPCENFIYLALLDI